MAESDKAQATFTLSFEDQISGSAEEGAQALLALQKQIADSEIGIKQLVAEQRRLKGTSDEVKAASAELKARIQSQKEAVTSASLALHKQGTSYEELAAQARKAARQQEELKKQTDATDAKKAKSQADSLAEGLRGVGGPAESLVGKFESLSKVLTGAGGPMGLVTLGAVALSAALIAVGAAAVASFVALGKWVIGSADAARSQQLLREAVAGSTANATALGTQIDALGDKVPTAKAQLNELAVTLARNGLQGQTLVDSYNAVGQAAAAAGDSAGSKIQELLERGKIMQRFSLGRFELQGTGLQRDDVAKELAGNLKVSIAQATAALAEGRVKLADGAAAMRQAVEKKFAGINLRKMLSLDNIGETFRKTFSKLTEGVNIEPLLQGFGEIAKLFDTSSVSGAALKDILTRIGNGIGTTFKDSVPTIKGFIKGLIIGALEIEVAYYTVRNAIRNAFGGADVLKNIDGAKLACEGAKVAVLALAGGFALLAAGAALAFVVLGAPAIAGVAAWIALVAGVKAAHAYVTGINWTQIGANIIDGLVGGITSGVGKVVDAVKGLANSVKNTFTGEMKIHSPSRVFDDYGENTPKGYAQGVNRGTPGAVDAVKDMAAQASAAGAGVTADDVAGVGLAPGAGPAPSSAGGGGAAGGKAAPTSITVQVSVQVDATGSPQETAQKLQDKGTWSTLASTLEEVLTSMGLPVQVPT